jgi:hypothetical protein
MQKLWGAFIVVAAAVVGTINTASAQPWHGKILSIGDSKWEVQEACGEPSYVEESVEIIPKPVYDVIQYVYVQISIYINRSIWTYTFGPTSLIYILTSRGNKLDKVETGGYGR